MAVVPWVLYFCPYCAAKLPVYGRHGQLEFGPNVWHKPWSRYHQQRGMTSERMRCGICKRVVRVQPLTSSWQAAGAGQGKSTKP